MATLNEILKAEVEKYAGDDDINLKSYAMLDDVRQTYGVVAVDYPKREDIAGVVVMARIAGDHVIIEEDMTDKKLVDALMQAGIPREKIILAYDGEPIPEIES